MFSELVDRIVRDTARGDKRLAVAGFVNDIIQRIHAKNNWDRDNREARADNYEIDCKLVWPRPRDFRKMKISWINGNPDRQTEFVSMSSKVARMDWDYHYYSDESFVFCGQGIQFVSLMYLQKPPHFKYYPENERPAYWDDSLNYGQGGWMYLTPDGKTHVPAMEAEREYWARYAVTDWLLEEYSSVIYWGALNQLYTLIDDEAQRRSSYSLFVSGIEDIKRDNICSDISEQS